MDKKTGLMTAGLVVLGVTTITAVGLWQQDNITQLWNDIWGHESDTTKPGDTDVTTTVWTIMYVANGETLAQGTEVHSADGSIVGSTVTEPTAPELEGYTYVGWQQVVDDTTHTITYTANYIEGVEWTIRWLGKDGTEITSVKVYMDTDTGQPVPGTPNADVTDPEAPEVEGYIFREWDSAVDADSKIITNTAVYDAVYTYNIYHYDIEGEQIGDVTTATGDYGGALYTEITHPEVTATVGTLTHSGWSTYTVAGEAIYYYAMYSNNYYNYYYDAVNDCDIYEPIQESQLEDRSSQYIDTPLEITTDNYQDTVVLAEGTEASLSGDNYDINAPIYIEMMITIGADAEPILVNTWLHLTEGVGSSYTIQLGDNTMTLELVGVPTQAGSGGISTGTTPTLRLTNIPQLEETMTVQIYTIQQIVLAITVPGGDITVPGDGSITIG